MTAWQISSMWTSGRQGVPSLVILISLVVQANPARLLRTMSNRMRGLTPKCRGVTQEYREIHVGECADIALDQYLAPGIGGLRIGRRLLAAFAIVLGGPW